MAAAAKPRKRIVAELVVSPTGGDRPLADAAEADTPFEPPLPAQQREASAWASANLGPDRKVFVDLADAANKEVDWRKVGDAPGDRLRPPVPAAAAPPACRRWCCRRRRQLSRPPRPCIWCAHRSSRSAACRSPPSSPRSPPMLPPATMRCCCGCGGPPRRRRPAVALGVDSWPGRTAAACARAARPERSPTAPEPACRAAAGGRRTHGPA